MGYSHVYLSRWNVFVCVITTTFVAVVLFLIVVVTTIVLVSIKSDSDDT